MTKQVKRQIQRFSWRLPLPAADIFTVTGPKKSMSLYKNAGLYSVSRLQLGTKFCSLRLRDSWRTDKLLAMKQHQKREPTPQVGERRACSSRRPVDESESFLIFRCQPYLVVQLLNVRANRYRRSSESQQNSYQVHQIIGTFQQMFVDRCSMIFGSPVICFVRTTFRFVGGH